MAAANTLPTGWKKEQKIRKKGMSKGKVDTYITCPFGNVFRSKRALEEHLTEKKTAFKHKRFLPFK